MSRGPLAVSAAGGSITSLLWHFFVDNWKQPTWDTTADLCITSTSQSSSIHILGFRLDFPSLILGLILGLALGPVLEVVVLLRQLWTAAIRRHFLASSRTSPLFRVI